MSLKKLWSGKLPSYWDITTWASLAKHFLVVCYREPTTRKKMLQSYNLKTGISTKTESVYNGILGTNGTVVFQMLITDARSHIQINRILSYDVSSQLVNWTVNEPFLVEKYKIPQIICSNIGSYNLGNKYINLYTGEVFNAAPTYKQRGWKLGNNLILEQHGADLVCLNSQSDQVWNKQGFLGSWYHGLKGDSLYFLLPDDYLVVIDLKSGKELMRSFLKDLKKVSGRVFGSFDYKNDRSFDNCTIADVLIHDNLAVWVTESNNLATRDLISGQVVVRDDLMGDYDLCLSSINNEYLLLYDIKDANYGSLLYMKVEELIHGAINSRTRE